MRDVLLFVPCFVDLLDPEVGQATVLLLERAGLRVHYPPEQTCCGQPAFTSGHHVEARVVASRAAEVFMRAGRELGECRDVVTPSASCAGFMAHELQGLGVTHDLVVHELFEFLEQELDAGESLGGEARARRAVLHPACHLLRGMGGDAALRRLLARVPGLELVTSGEEESCCGFGGIFAAREPAVSVAMARTKIDAARTVGAELIISSDSSCGMQLASIAQGLPVVNAVSVLAGMA